MLVFGSQNVQFTVCVHVLYHTISVGVLVCVFTSVCRGCIYTVHVDYLIVPPFPAG